jgi:hypothetical protein
MELGRAQHHFDSRPEAAREALADAIVQAQETLEELRALSRGIAPPILTDRGLREALTALAARSTVPVELDAGPWTAGRMLLLKQPHMSWSPRLSPTWPSTAALAGVRSDCATARRRCGSG